MRFFDTEAGMVAAAILALGFAATFVIISLSLIPSNNLTTCVGHQGTYHRHGNVETCTPKGR